MARADVPPAGRRSAADRLPSILESRRPHCRTCCPRAPPRSPLRSFGRLGSARRAQCADDQHFEGDVGRISQHGGDEARAPPVFQPAPTAHPWPGAAASKTSSARSNLPQVRAELGFGQRARFQDHLQLLLVRPLLRLFASGDASSSVGILRRRVDASFNHASLDRLLSRPRLRPVSLAPSWNDMRRCTKAPHASVSPTENPVIERSDNYSAHRGGRQSHVGAAPDAAGSRHERARAVHRSIDTDVPARAHQTSRESGRADVSVRNCKP